MDTNGSSSQQCGSIFCRGECNGGSCAMLIPWSLGFCTSVRYAPCSGSVRGPRVRIRLHDKRLQIRPGHWIRLKSLLDYVCTTCLVQHSRNLRNYRGLYRLVYQRSPGTPGGLEYVKFNGCSRDRMEPDPSPQTFTPCFPVPQSAKLHPRTILLRTLELTLFRKCNVELRPCVWGKSWGMRGICTFRKLGFSPEVWMACSSPDLSGSHHALEQIILHLTSPYHGVR